MPFLHPNQPIQVVTIDGVNFGLLEPLPFRLRDGRLLRVKLGATTDGLSAPHFTKYTLQTTNSFYPAVAHDGFYRDCLEISKDEGVTWSDYPVPRTDEAKDDADHCLHELAVDNGVTEEMANVLYFAVQEFGKPAFDKRGK